ncbi:MAG: cupredoxin domain-containing protein [Actinobacteria bacterium]|nr:cupredoxin domain-containing protein [Actinomycetota bacterium]
MRKFLLVPTALLALAFASNAAAATKDVRIVKTGFSPISLQVNAGDTVRWTNRDTTSHQVVSDRGAFVSTILAPGKTFSFTFKAAGTYRYRDALEPAERGAVTVKGLPPTVSIGASSPIVVYGAEIKISGLVSSLKAGEQVTLWAQPHGQSSFVQIAVLTTVTGGAWDYNTKPTVLTTYQARSKNAASQPVVVQVKPKISLLPGKRGYFYARVSAGVSFAGKTVYLQRRTLFGQWVSVQRLTLGSQSGRIFKVPRRKGTWSYRIFMGVDAAGSGYLESWSGTQTVRRK